MMLPIGAMNSSDAEAALAASQDPRDEADSALLVMHDSSAGEGFGFNFMMGGFATPGQDLVSSGSSSSSDGRQYKFAGKLPPTVPKLKPSPASQLTPPTAGAPTHESVAQQTRLPPPTQVTATVAETAPAETAPAVATSMQRQDVIKL